MGYAQIDETPTMNVDSGHVNAAMTPMGDLEDLLFDLKNQEAFEKHPTDKIYTMVKLWKSVGMLLRGQFYLNGSAHIWSRGGSMEFLVWDAVAVTLARVRELRRICVASRNKSGNSNNQMVYEAFTMAESAIQVVLVNYRQRLQWDKAFDEDKALYNALIRV